MATTTVTSNSNSSGSGDHGLSSFAPVKIGSLTCRPLHPSFGAEIEGVDFSKPVSDEQIKDIIEALNRFGVTVYRKTNLTNESHVAFSAKFGELEKAMDLNGLSSSTRFGYREITDIGNTNDDGSIISRDNRRWWFNKGNTLWHTDSSFNQHRAKYSLLLAHITPKDGGDTQYADVRRAFRDLPEERKAQLRELVCKHHIWHSKRLAAPEAFKNISEAEMNAKKPAYHKLVQIAPDGEETFYIASHISETVGMPKEEGSKLIKGLIEYCSQPQYFLSVRWQQPGDLVFWDNRCTMHRATPFTDQMEVRDMRRTTVYDDGPYGNGVPDAESLQA